MSEWHEASPTLHSMTIPACFKVWVIQNGENRWQIEIARRARIAESDTLDGAKSEALTWARELLTNALTELETIK